MNIKQFKKLSAITDPLMQEFVLFHLLDRDDWDNKTNVEGFEHLKDLDKAYFQYQDTEFQTQYINVILDLAEIELDDFERLIQFATTNDIILERDLESYLDDIEGEGVALPFEVFKPLVNSQAFKDQLTIDSDTGEVFPTLYNDVDIHTGRLLGQIEQIIDFRLNQLK